MSVRSYNKNLAHLIWSTQNREKLLADKQLRKELSQYYYDCPVEKDIYMKINYVNTEHVHTLIHLPANLTVDKVIRQSFNKISRQFRGNITPVFFSIII
jgi:REP element-mobilizing transposase RayT